MIVRTPGVYRNGKVELIVQKEAPPDGTPVVVQYEDRRRKSFQAHSGTLSDEEARQILSAIEDGCERIDSGEW